VLDGVLKAARGRRFALPLLLLVGVVGCADPSRRFAVVSVPLGDGTVLYFKKETWGLNGERTVISRRPDWPEPTGDGEYEYCCGAPLPVFRVEGSALRLYVQHPDTWRHQGAASVPVVLQEANISDLHDLSCGRGPYAARVIDFWDWPLEARGGKAVSIDQVEERRGPTRLTTRCN
jgi:hypothetical protein